ncbi:MAG: hypothetical protein FJY88_03775 [Candidatus Eisenbacteria bacterium]|nr:hypothetical protein [Candidatus Eisenbacteria bacterium]
MLLELEKLEERIAEAAEAVRVLREQNGDLLGRIAHLEEERDRLLEEREDLAERIGRLVQKIDALRTEL